MKSSIEILVISLFLGILNGCTNDRANDPTVQNLQANPQSTFSSDVAEKVNRA
jgi:hypothetical protein